MNDNKDAEDILFEELEGSKEIVNIIRVEEELLCKGTLVCEESRIENKSFEEELDCEAEIDIYIIKSIVNDVDTVQLLNEIICNIQACFTGNHSSITTSTLQDIEFNAINNRLYLTTLNSIYVFKVNEWLLSAFPTKT
ncbi:hypothetical protein [Ruminiclostridium josui]|uniref:hypothetical protein n=1 Tax=Ruminiclostridium josui TaxID=1499 RepID=UPI000466C877|nr:hypothetical protein [Ruminiclostridium josui]